MAKFLLDEPRARHNPTQTLPQNVLVLLKAAAEETASVVEVADPQFLSP